MSWNPFSQFGENVRHYLCVCTYIYIYENITRSHTHTHTWPYCGGSCMFKGSMKRPWALHPAGHRCEPVQQVSVIMNQTPSKKDPRTRTKNRHPTIMCVTIGQVQGVLCLDPSGSLGGDNYRSPTCFWRDTASRYLDRRRPSSVEANMLQKRQKRLP